MMQSRHHLTLIDLMAAIGAAAFGLAWVVWVAPGRIVPMLIVVGPLLGILCDRWRGGRGVLGGTLGGAIYAVTGLIWLNFGPYRPRAAGLSSIVDWLIQMVVVTAVSLIFGTLMGVAAWLAAAMMGRPAAPTLPSQNARLARDLGSMDEPLLPRPGPNPDS